MTKKESRRRVEPTPIEPYSPHYADTRAMPNLLEISLFDNMLPPF